MPILPVNLSIPPITPPAIGGANPGPGGAAFGSVLASAIAKVDGYQQNAQASVERFLSGEGEELHHLAIASQQADLSFQLFMQLRNKVVTAYQQIMQMQV